jgi:hypothetical protein
MNRPQSNRFVCALVILSHLTTSWVASANVGGPSVGILGGLGTTGKSERSFEILERRLQRWLEDEGAQGLAVHAVPGRESEYSNQLELERLQLRHASQELLSATPIGASSAAANAKVKSLLQRLENVEVFGPELQLAYSALAVQAIRNGKRGEAARFLLPAKRLHPEGKLAATLPWNWEGLPERETLENLWADLPESARSCRMTVEGVSAQETVYVNGFAIQNREIQVVPGQTFTFARGTASDELGSFVAACSGPGQRTVRLQSAPVLAWGWDEARKFSLSKISQRHSVATLLVLDKAGDEYNIFVFTPGLGLDQVPTEKPLRSEDIRQSPELPIRWERLQSLIQKHRQESARLALGAAGAGDTFSIAASGRSSPATLDYTVDTTPWYARPSTWVVAGVIASGIAVAVLASRSQSPVQNSSSGLAIRF